MFRTIYVVQGEKITVKDNWLVISVCETEKKIPLEDIQTIVLDNPHTMVSLYSLNALANSGANIIICDSKHMPSCNVLSFTNHYSPYGVLKKQLALTNEFKGMLWQKIIQAKITNQSYALQFIGEDSKIVARLKELAFEVQLGDIGNREGIAARLFFRNFYGYDFTRFEDDVINKAMNYGYAIIRSIVARSLSAYGYNCALGLHHINENNAFNLADDIMEPIRPLVDLWVNKHSEELIDELTKENKISLINIGNEEMIVARKHMKLYNAVDKYVASLTTAINNNDANKLECPSLV